MAMIGQLYAGGGAKPSKKTNAATPGIPGWLQQLQARAAQGANQAARDAQARQSAQQSQPQQQQKSLFDQMQDLMRNVSRGMNEGVEVFNDGVEAFARNPVDTLRNLPQFAGSTGGKALALTAGASVGRPWGALFQPPESQSQNRGIFGVHYGPNWTRGTYTPPPDWRSGEGAAQQMTKQEYMVRRNAWERMFQPGLQEWIDRAAATPNEPHDIYSQWRARNPKPSGFLQTNQEWIVRNNAAPTGYTYAPFGSSYIRNPQLPPVGSAPQSSSAGAQGGGGWGGYGYGGGGGRGRSYPQTVAPSPRDYWNQFLNWRVLEVQGG